MSLTQLSIPFLRASFPSTLHEDLAEVLNSGYVGAGAHVEFFEHALEDYLGASTVLATSSCTAALTLAYIDAGIKQGSVVLSTPMTCAATNIPLLQLGAKIAWLDVDPFSGNVTSEFVAQGFNRYPEAQAVVIMDWGGVPCDYSSILAECRLRGTPLILDAAQSFGSLHEGKRYPSDIDYVCYSFGPTKLFSTVEGGAIAIKAHLDAQRIRTLRWYGIRRESRDPLRFWEYQIEEELGYRFVFNNVFAAIGLRLLPALDARLSHHRKLAEIYDELLSETPGLRLGKRVPTSDPNFWLYTVLVDEREQFLTRLHSHGIHAATPHRRNDKLLATWNELNAFVNCPGVDQFDQSYVCLPIGPWLQIDDIKRVCGLIKKGLVESV